MKCELWSYGTPGVSTAKYHLTTEVASMLLPELLHNDKKYVRIIFENQSPLFLNSYEELKQFTEDFYDRKYSQNVEKESQENMAKDAINPSHYKDIIPGMQYIQMMEYLLKDHQGVAAHLLGQIYKYSTRLGKKDSLEQDSAKIAWYACCLRDYYKTGSIPKELNY